MLSVMESYFDEFQNAAPKDVDDFIKDTYEVEMALSDRWGIWYFVEGWGLSTRQEFIRQCLKYPDSFDNLYLTEVYDYHS